MPVAGRTSLAIIAINSTACYVLAFLLTTVLHECGHAFVGAWLGSRPILHHNYVEHLDRGSLPVAYQVAIAFAGPLISLIQGSAFALWFHRWQGGGIFRLLALWLMLLGFGNFLGYLMTGPFFTAGDIGKAYVLMSTPMIARVAVAIVGAAALTFICYRVSRPFLHFAVDPDDLNDAGARKRFAFHIIILPWVIGSLIVTALYLPIIALISIIYPFTSGMVFIFPWQQAKREREARAMGHPSLQRISWPMIMLLFVLILLFRLVLAPGIEM